MWGYVGAFCLGWFLMGLRVHTIRRLRRKMIESINKRHNAPPN